jgi:type I restriction enzyme S subunit
MFWGVLPLPFWWADGVMLVSEGLQGISKSMDLKTFFEQFDTIAEAPGGIQRLRSLILDMAVRGKLVPQDPNDEPAEKLLEKIREERTKLIKQKLIKKEKSLLEVDEYEIPHSLPNSWIWTRLGEITLYTIAEKVNSAEIPEDAWLLDLEDIEKDTSRLIRRKSFQEKPSKSTKSHFKSGDVLYGKLRPYLNKVLVADSDGYCTTEIIPIRPHSGIDSEYLRYVLKRSDFLKYVNSKTYGINLPRLGTDDARNAVFPLPPIAEQKRIVAKVDELMGLCDQFEAEKQKRDTLRQRLRASAFDALMNAPTDDALSTAWSFIHQHWHPLTQHPDDVEDVRRSLLQLAVRGKLVPQDPNDEPAEVGLSKIKQSRKQLLESGEIKKTKGRSCLVEEGLPPKPSNWVYCFLQDLAIFGPRNGYSPKAVEHPTSVRSITLTATTSGQFDGQYFKYIDEEIDPQSYLWLQPGDLLIQRSNTLAYVGTAAIYNENSGKYIYPDLIMRIRLSDEVNVKYIHLVVNSKASKEYFQANASGTSGTMPKINQKIVNSLVIPLPPLAEQKRIVAKVDDLMRECDQLEAHLRQQQQVAEQLAASAVSHLVV